MKIALVQEKSMKQTNKIVFEILEKVAKKYGYAIYNYTKDTDISYVEASLLTAILLNSKAVDFVVSGCSSAEGVMICSNQFPNVICGYVKDNIDMELFLKVNAGNAISIPYGRILGLGMEKTLENIFEVLCSTKRGSGYPKERKEIQEKERKEVEEISRISHINMKEILEEMDKDMLYHTIHNDYFEENFFFQSEDDELSEYLKNIIDTWESEV